MLRRQCDYPLEEKASWEGKLVSSSEDNSRCITYGSISFTLFPHKASTMELALYPSTDHCD